MSHPGLGNHTNHILEKFDVEANQEIQLQLTDLSPGNPRFLKCMIKLASADLHPGSNIVISAWSEPSQTKCYLEVYGSYNAQASATPIMMNHAAHAEIDHLDGNPNVFSVDITLETKSAGSTYLDIQLKSNKTNPTQS